MKHDTQHHHQMNHIQRAHQRIIRDEQREHRLFVIQSIIISLLILAAAIVEGLAP